jgi:hypothetical protein
MVYFTCIDLSILVGRRSVFETQLVFIRMKQGNSETHRREKKSGINLESCELRWFVLYNYWFCIRIRIKNENILVGYFISTRGQDSSVGIATRYGLDVSGIQSRWERDIPHSSRPTLGGPPRLLCNGYRGSFPGVRCGRGLALTTYPILRRG